MFLVCVRTVFRDTVSSRAMSGPLRSVRSSRRTWSSRSLSGSTRPRWTGVLGALEPTTQRGLLALLSHPCDRQLDEVCGSLEVLARQCVADRCRLIAISGVPVACPPVQPVDLVALLIEQAGSKHVCEQMVVAVPKSTVVERDEEQVSPVECLEHGRSAVLAGHGIA